MNFSVSENKESQHKSERFIYQSLAKTKPREKKPASEEKLRKDD